MVQTFAIFADDPTTAKIKTAKSFNSPVGTTLYSNVTKIRTTKISSGATSGIFAKVCTRRNFPLYCIILLSDTGKYHEFTAAYCYECKARVTMPKAMK